MRASAVDVHVVIVAGVGALRTCAGRSDRAGAGARTETAAPFRGPPAMPRGDIQPAARPKSTYIAAPPPMNPPWVVADQ